MPWEHCDTSIDDDGPCPACGLAKEQWTLHFDVTRTFKVATKASGTAQLKLVLQAPGGDYVADAPFRATFADGTVVEGALDANGYAKVTAPVSGECRVEFPGRRVKTKSDGRLLGSTTTLTTGPKHALVLAKSSRGVAVPAAVFAFDSSFPGPGIFIHLHEVAKLADELAQARLLVFGHADASGGEEYNKKLSDRRARAVLALLTNDLALFDAVAAEEAWGLGQDQAMLRGVGCNPGVIDGVDGPDTQAAVRAFQEEYNDGVFHRAPGATRAHADLTVDGLMGPKTRAALRDAYVWVAPGNLKAERFLGPRFAGCGEFNLVAEGASADNRRVIVGFFEGAPPATVPCKAGDVAACPVDAERPTRCPFYREHVDEERRPTRSFFDFQWLRIGGKAHLSALTSVPDGTPAKLTVYRWKGKLPEPPPDSSRGDPRPEGHEVLATLDATIKGGVAWATWAYPEEQDPFDLWRWFEDLDLDASEDAEAVLARDAMSPPLFALEAGGAWGYSRPPGRRLSRVRFTEQPTSKGLALCSDGVVRAFKAMAGQPVRSLDEELHVFAVALDERGLEVEAQEEGA